MPGAAAPPVRSITWRTAATYVLINFLKSAFTSGQPTQLQRLLWVAPYSERVWELPASANPEIRAVWRAHVDEAADYSDEASEHWGLSFIRRADSSYAAEIAGRALRVCRSDHVSESRTGASNWRHTS